MWTPATANTTLNNNFTELGNIAVNFRGDVIATDRGANKVYLVDATGSHTGSRTRIAGTGAVTGFLEGTPALDNALYGVRGVWLLPNGGYFLATHEGSQVLYVDIAGILRAFIDGQAGNAHTGDGEFFRSPGFKVSEVRSITTDSEGNLLITENGFGYVRSVQFLPMQP